jgi:hypothetical protein
VIAAMLATAVVISGQAFEPGHVTVVAGDTVAWRNTDFVEHDVRAADGSFDSGRLARFSAYAHRFDRVAAVPYLCTLHPFMRGQVDVAGALLHDPHGPVSAGFPLRLEGRAAAGATAVTLERRRDDGGWDAILTAAPDAGSMFAFVVTPAVSSTYRAVTTAGPSPPVALRVSARIVVRVRLRGRRLTVRTRPAVPHARAVLERYARWHYMWRALARRRLSGRGRTTFRLSAITPGRLRVRLAPDIATSRPVRVKTETRPRARSSELTHWRGAS